MTQTTPTFFGLKKNQGEKKGNFQGEKNQGEKKGNFKLGGKKRKFQIFLL
jgi:hypothetical protein